MGDALTEPHVKWVVGRRESGPELDQVLDLVIADLEAEIADARPDAQPLDLTLDAEALARGGELLVARALELLLKLEPLVVALRSDRLQADVGRHRALAVQ